MTMPIPTMGPTASRYAELLGRLRKLTATLIWCSDEYTSLAAELSFSGAKNEPDAGGLGPNDFTGQYADLTREDILAMDTLLNSLFTPLTPEQRALFYRVKDARRLTGGPLV